MHIAVAAECFVVPTLGNNGVVIDACGRRAETDCLTVPAVPAAVVVLVAVDFKPPAVVDFYAERAYRARHRLILENKFRVRAAGCEGVRNVRFLGNER